MTPRHCRVAGLPLAALALGCGSRGGGAYSLDVGADDGGPAFLPGTEASAGALDAHIEQNHLAVTFVTLSCAGPCADVVTVPTGGRAPYTFTWDDGPTGSSRHVCPTSSTSYLVKVTDTGTSGEFAQPAETVQVPLRANTVACPDAGEADAAACNPDASSVFAVSPSTVEVDANGSTRYLMNGASLPAGRYEAQWTDGCMRYAVGGLRVHKRTARLQQITVIVTASRRDERSTLPQESGHVRLQRPEGEPPCRKKERELSK